MPHSRKHLSNPGSGCHHHGNRYISTLLGHLWTIYEHLWVFLIAIDTHFKWPKVTLMKSNTSDKTISALRSIFARNGLAEQIVSDSSPQFTSEFSLSIKKNGIKHFRSMLHHSVTNGLAERFVQTFKKFMKAMDVQKGNWHSSSSTKWTTSSLPTETPFMQ